MTIEEAKKYGFRTDKNGALIVWTTVLDFMPCRPTKVQLGEKCVPLIGIHFPTRSEARAKRYWNSELQAMMDKKSEREDPLVENDRRSRLAKCLKSMEPITKEQAKDLRPYDTVYVLSPFIDSKCVRPWPWGEANNSNDAAGLKAHVFYWTRAAAESALAKPRLSEQKRLLSEDKPCSVTYNSHKFYGALPVGEISKSAKELLKDMGDEGNSRKKLVPVAPTEKDARIKALVDGYKAKGGPITKEQLTDEVRKWCYNSFPGVPYWSFYNPQGDIDQNIEKPWHIGETRYPSDFNLSLKQAFWNKSDAEHAKWLDDMQSQTTPITQEQGEVLRDGDRIYGFKYGCVDAEHLVCFENPVTVGCVDDTGIIKAGKAYFTRSAAQAALNKAKAEAEPLEWCERKAGEGQLTDEATWSSTVNLQAASLGGLTTDKVTLGWVSSNFGQWYEAPFVEHHPKGMDRFVIRARYRNPLWLAKHGHKGMVFNNNTNRWEPDPLASHETPVGETQGREVVTDETQHSPSRTLSDAEFKNLVGRMSLPQLYDALKANGVKLEGIGLEPKKVDEQSVLEEAAKVGNKYHRTIHGVIGGSIVVDVYNVIDAFGVTCPACQHAIKKLLCAGLRNKGSRLQDLTESKRSVERAVELEQQRNEGVK